MIRAVHSKTYLIFVVLIAIYCITIEEVYCSESAHATESESAHVTESASDHATESANEDGSMSGFEYQSLDTAICIDNIIEDLDCETAENCAINMFNDYTYDELKHDSSKKYIRYVYGKMVEEPMRKIYSPLEKCKIEMNEDEKMNNKSSDSLDCTTDFLVGGFWNLYTCVAVESYFFWTKMNTLSEEDYYYGHYIRKRFTSSNTALTHAYTAPIFCEDSCTTQIKIAFGGHSNATSCAIYAFKYLVIEDLMDYARLYAEYLYKFIRLKNRQLSDTPNSYCELFRALNERSTVKMSESALQSRIEGCKFDLTQADIILIDKDMLNLINSITGDANTSNGANNNPEDANTSNGANNNPEDANTSNGENDNPEVKQVDIEFVKYVFDNISYTYLDESSDAYSYLNHLLFERTVDFTAFQEAKDPFEFCNDSE